MKKKMNVAIIGSRFMGKAHSNAWKKAPLFFDMDIEPVLKVACARQEGPLKEFAERWGWEDIETDWKRVMERNDVDIVDICVPQYLHFEIAKAAVQAGKHVFLEKPMVMNVQEAQELYELVKSSKVTHYINHNYRRCPAVRLAKKMIDQGKIGTIFHWRGAYLQDWIVDPDFPLTWHLRKETAGMGPQGDLNSHSVDLARYLIGDITKVSCMTSQIIEERPLPDETVSGTFSGTAADGRGKVTVEDAAFMIVRFENGALGSFDTSRFAPGRKNYNYFEIYGSKGSLIFNLERMNELQYLNREDPDYQQGFKTILATEGVHDYVANWWPPGHVIGYEHEFVHAVVDFMDAVNTGEEIRPNFYDGLKELQILEAGLESAQSGKEVIL
jgi:predicted dehydrogenase